MEIVMTIPTLDLACTFESELNIRGAMVLIRGYISILEGACHMDV